MRVREGDGAYYLEAKKILENTKNFFGVVAKTPSLFFPPVKDYQLEYYNTLIKRIDEGQVSMKYMFSLPYTEEEIVRISRQNPQQALDVLSQWQKYSNGYPKIDLRYFRMKNSVSFCVGDKETTALISTPKRGAATFENTEEPKYQNFLNSLHEKSKKNHDKIISEIKAKLSVTGQVSYIM